MSQQNSPSGVGGIYLYRLLPRNRRRVSRSTYVISKFSEVPQAQCLWDFVISKPLILPLFFRKSELINDFVSRKSKNVRILGWENHKESSENGAGLKGRGIIDTYIPLKLEYSSKDDKFRLITCGRHFSSIINLGRIKDCEILGKYDLPTLRDASRKFELTFELTDNRNSLERVMLAFSDCRKETRRLDEKRYTVKLWYSPDDETEILIRILSFGQMIKVLEPQSFINLIKERLQMQSKLNL